MRKNENIFKFNVENSFYKIFINDIIVLSNYIDGYKNFNIIIKYQNGIQVLINFLSDKNLGNQNFSELQTKLNK